MEERPSVEVRRSRRRRRTVSAYRDEDGTVVVLLPARMTRAEEQEWVATMVARLQRSEERRRPSDEGLARRAEALSAKYLAGLARPESVRWVHNQRSRWGSCTPADRAIRLSSRLQGMPPWVVDYVLLHELAHLLEHGHTPTFWRMVDQYPKAERAKGFLEGVALGATLGLDPTDVPHGDGGDVDSGVEAGPVVAEAVVPEPPLDTELDELAQ
jgi:predicted metal-dependent hydrolase